MERLSSSCECNIMGRWDVRFLFSVVSFEISSIIFWKTATVNCSCIVPTTIIIWPSRYGYVLAASKLNIRHEIWNLQTVCWTSFPSLDSAHILWLFRSLEPQRNYWERLRCCTTTLKSRCSGRVIIECVNGAKLLMTSLLLHCSSVVFICSLASLFPKVGEKGGSWHKGREGAGENYIWPVPNDADQVASEKPRMMIKYDTFSGHCKIYGSFARRTRSSRWTAIHASLRLLVLTCDRDIDV